MYAVDALSRKLKLLIASERRRNAGEVIITFLVGVISCLLIYGVTFWTIWLGIYLFGGSYRHQALLVAFIIVVVFALFSFWYAWRGIDPISDVDIDLTVPRRHGAELAIGLALGIPIIRRASLAGFASLLIGGPANLLDAWSLWRSRLRADDALLDAASKLLRDAVQGISADQVNNPSAVALLARMGLIKANIGQNDQLILQATVKGAEMSSS